MLDATNNSGGNNKRGGLVNSRDGEYASASDRSGARRFGKKGKGSKGK